MENIITQPGDGDGQDMPLPPPDWARIDAVAASLGLLTGAQDRPSLELEPHPAEYMSPARYALWCAEVDRMAAERGLPPYGTPRDGAR